jgi:hypothetical protein
VNEIQLIRAQLEVERERAQAIAAACSAALAQAAPAALSSASPLEQFRQACVDYLVCVLAWFEERDRRLAGLLDRYDPHDPTRDALDGALTGPGRSRDALEKLEAAFAAHTSGAARWQEFAQYISGPWSARREALETLLAGGARTPEWRAVSGIDADVMLEERGRFARVNATLPPGLKLTAARRTPRASGA